MVVELQCELCGRECKECKPALVDGVKMMLCPGCMRHGKGVKTVTTVDNQSILSRIKKPMEKDVYQNMNKELVSNWNELIKDARQRKGLTREQLGFQIGERTVTISKIENGDLRPADKMVKKLEKVLNIKLNEEVKKVDSSIKISQSKSGFTLGDFIKDEV
jgi:putative transcription factor